jgi:hypothetical protein
MRYVFSTLAALAWALWFGGLMTLFVSVQSMFARDRAVAVDAAPMLFAAFERYQLLLAAIAIVSTFGWWLTVRSRRVIAVALLLALAVLGAVASSTLVTPRLERLRLAGESGSPAFLSLHGQSMMLYVGEAAALLVAGMILPAALRHAGPPPVPSPGIPGES